MKKRLSIYPGKTIHLKGKTKPLQQNIYFIDQEMFIVQGFQLIDLQYTKQSHK